MTNSCWERSSSVADLKKSRPSTSTAVARERQVEPRFGPPLTEVEELVLPAVEALLVLLDLQAAHPEEGEDSMAVVRSWLFFNALIQCGSSEVSCWTEVENQSQINTPKKLPAES